MSQNRPGMHRRITNLRNEHPPNDKICISALKERKRHSHSHYYMMDNHRLVQKSIPGHAQKVISEVPYRSINQILLIRSVDISALPLEEVVLIRCAKEYEGSMDG